MARILAVNFYLRGREVDARSGRYPRSHLWGVDELSHHGHEVTLLSDQDACSGAFPWKLATRLTRGYFGDLHLHRAVMRAARTADLVYIVSGDFPLLRRARHRGSLNARTVGWLYAPTHPLRRTAARRMVQLLPAGFGFDGLFCLTRATESFVREKCPPTLARFVEWGADLELFKPVPPGAVLDHGFACGKTGRDFATLVDGVKRSGVPFRLLAPRSSLSGLQIPANILQVGGPRTPGDDLGIDYAELVRQQQCAAVHVICLEKDPLSTNGLTNLLEALAVGRPVVMTRTGILDIDIEAEGVGVYVPPRDPAALGAALRSLVMDRPRADAMGARGRALVERRHSLSKFGEAVSGFVADILKRGTST